MINVHNVPVSAAAARLMNPADIILEQSNDECSYLLDKSSKLAAGSNDNENTSSLIEDEYIIVDPITENYRQKMKQKKKDELSRSKSEAEMLGDDDSVNNH